MRCALEQVIDIVTEARGCADNKILPASIHDGIKDFKVSEISWGGGGMQSISRFVDQGVFFLFP